MSQSRNLKCKFRYLIAFWALFGPWAFHSYFLGDNSLATLAKLKRTYARLEREMRYWQDRNEFLKERLASLNAHKDYYYHKLGREMLVKGKEGEEVILFVK